MKFGFLGIPWDVTSSLGWPGSRYAPEEVRRAFRWLEMRLASGAVYWLDREQVVGMPDAGFVIDRGDVEVMADDREETFARISAAARACADEGQVLMAVGGDDAVTYPVVRGLHDRSTGTWGMLHLDAHLDLMDRSEYQGAHSHSSGIRRITELSRFRPEALVQIGVRNFNFAASHAYVQERGIQHIPASEFWRIGTEAAVERALGLVAGVDHVHLAIDVDVLEPGFAPGAGAFEPGGLMPRQLQDFVAAVAPRVDAVSLVEVNPLTDYRNMTSALGANILAQFVVSRLAAER